MAECAVVPVPDEAVTNRLLACVVVRECDAADVARLMRTCRERLPYCMVPHHFAFHDTLPRTSTGKVDRRALLTGAGRDSQTSAGR
ncbi:hypothetical protein [Streptomyces sp. H27-C3]|uniref:AMP-binding enzyme n=1 Tax=Streptomyces sp. H27-C3 TaxID=3046305 RepID=UPI0024B958A1|nr:hypothetical protein [Streptomyces sp. H27-C3]MDJ0463845.1 hypothetical protein [Streptomyces sp. H27-C3]